MGKSKLTFNEATGEIFLKDPPQLGGEHQIWHEFEAEGTVADFDGTYYLTTGNEPDLSGTKTVRWKMYMEPNATGHLFALGVPLDNLTVRVISGQLWVGIYDSTTLDSSRWTEINSITGRTINCLAVKSSTKILWVQVDGYGFGNTNSSQSGTDYTTSRIGADGIDITPTSIANNMYVWDIQVDDEVAWEGNGSSANENSAWVDTIGSNNATWSATPTTFDIGTDPVPDFDDWFLPSTAELSSMKTNLFDESVGNFASAAYWTSTEVSSTQATAISFANGLQLPVNKSATPGYRVRPARSFIAGVGEYALRDPGPAGGLIFYIDGGTTYYEAAPNDNLTTGSWSNITNTASGATGASIGDGATNTPLITGQTDHIYSCAGLCEAYAVYL